VYKTFTDGQFHEFYLTTEISDNIEELENGYLKCKNVIMGRTGIQYYGDTAVNRHEEDVFHPDTLKSIEGKPVTLQHPKDFVDIDNAKDLQKGYILKVWRDGDNIVGDIIITDKETKDKILNKEMRELSLGYQAKVVKDYDGGWKQTEIVVNHLAVVEKGRAGNAMIVDHLDEFTRKEIDKMDEKNLTLGQKFLSFFGIKKAVMDDNSIIELKSINDEDAKDKKDDKDADKKEKDKKKDKDNDDKSKKQEDSADKFNDDYKERRQTITKEEFEGDYGKTTTVTKTESETIHEDKEENKELYIDEKEGETKMDKEKLTLDSALARIKSLEALKGTEAYEVQMKALDAECVEAGIGSIMPKKVEKKDSIFDSVDPSKNVVIEDSVATEKFNGKKYNTKIQNIYDGFKPRNLKEKSVVSRYNELRDKSSIEIADFVK